MKDIMRKASWVTKTAIAAAVVSAVAALVSTAASVAWAQQKDSGTLTARWGQDAKSSCSLGYALSAGDARSTSYATADAECR